MNRRAFFRSLIALVIPGTAMSHAEATTSPAFYLDARDGGTIDLTGVIDFTLSIEAEPHDWSFRDNRIV